MTKPIASLREQIGIVFTYSVPDSERVHILEKIVEQECKVAVASALDQIEAVNEVGFHRKPDMSDAIVIIGERVAVEIASIRTRYGIKEKNEEN